MSGPRRAMAAEVRDSPMSVVPSADQPAPDRTHLFEQLYSEHAAAVHRFCVSQVGEPSTAEDLTHETFVRAFSAYGRVRPEARGTRLWLVAIARNLSRDYHRARGRRGRLTERLRTAHTAGATVEQVVEQCAELRGVVAAMAELGDRDRELIGLRVAAGLAYAQVATVMGLSQGAVKVATFRALARLRSRVQLASEATISEVEAQR